MATPRCFEIRTYRSAPGKLEALLSRFRDDTMRIFDRFGIETVGFWSVADADDPATGHVAYVCVFQDLATAERAWEEFRSDAEWLRVRSESERNGPLTASVESRYMAATDFSPIQ